MLVGVRELLSAPGLQDLVVLLGGQIDLVELPQVLLAALNVIEVGRRTVVVVAVAIDLTAFDKFGQVVLVNARWCSSSVVCSRGATSLLGVVGRAAVTYAWRLARDPSGGPDDFAFRYDYVGLGEVA